jgi:hypothetical protein
MSPTKQSPGEFIELAKNGVRNPDRLCERVLDDIRKLPPHL